ncbi:hypothetical protein [Bradyrhizobium sp. Tv2a-2]|uniref:spike base protein, RCAP_Rcc01079 family n=1 Tax=Bradyrhizobium sp. Tv2a-2 TaxID=113395 RepID=UPI0003FA1E92|nr:hypothetical protein [Bradyrhizobium sp. Tv2a-2]
MSASAKDPFMGTSTEPLTAARHAEAVTPSDTIDLSHVTSAIYVGGAGDLTVLMANDILDTQTVTFKAVPVGTVLQLQARRILATGTTATNVVAMWS